MQSTWMSSYFHNRKTFFICSKISENQTTISLITKYYSLFPHPIFDCVGTQPCMHELETGSQIAADDEVISAADVYSPQKRKAE